MEESPICEVDSLCRFSTSAWDKQAREVWIAKGRRLKTYHQVFALLISQSRFSGEKFSLRHPVPFTIAFSFIADSNLEEKLF